MEEGKMDQTLRAPKVQGVATIIALMSGRKLLLAFNESEQAGKANHRRALERAVGHLGQYFIMYLETYVI